MFSSKYLKAKFEAWWLLVMAIIGDKEGGYVVQGSQ